MANDFYQDSGSPGTGSQGSSATMRAEFAAIESGFDKLPALTGNGGKLVAVNSGGTALEATGTITAASAFTGAVSVIDGSFSIKGSSDATKIAKFEVDGFTTGTTRTFTLPDVSDTVVTLAATQTLTNKTLTSPTINGGTLDGATIGASSAAAAIVTTLTTSGTALINVNSASNALEIRQIGAGNAIVIEDAANPDSTPFVVDTNGRVVTGHTAALSTYTASGITPNIQHVGTLQAISSVASAHFNSSTSSPVLWIGAKSAGATVGSYTAVGSDDDLFRIAAQGSDGTDFAVSGDILFGVDGTVGANQVPGDIAFRTANSSGALTQALRIDSSQSVVVGTSSALSTFSASTITPALQAVGTGGGSFLGLARFNVTTTAAPTILLGKSAAGTVGTYTAVASGDSLGTINAQGADGTDFAQSAALRFVCDGAVAANQVPGRIEMHVADSAGTLTAALRVNSALNVAMAATGRFYVDGVAATGDTYITESSANVLDLYAGGVNTLRLNAGGATVTGTLTASSLTSGRIPLVSTSGLLTDSGTFTYTDSATLRQVEINGSGSTLCDLKVLNSHATGYASLTLQTNGDGDAQIRVFSATGGIFWGAGTDGSDSGAFVVSENWTLGTNNRLKIASGGAVSIPGTLSVSGALTLSNLSDGTVPLIGSGGVVQAVVGFTYESTSANKTLTIDESGSISNGLTIRNSHASGLAELVAIATGTGDAQVRLFAGATSWTLGIDNSSSDAFVISANSALGTSNALSISTSLNATFGGSITTSAPTGGAGAWELGIANAVSPTSPNRTLTVEIGGTAYYIHAKTTND